MEKEDKEMRDWLAEMYHEKNMSLNQISKETGMNYTEIWRMFNKFGIAKRTIKKAMKTWWKGRKNK